MWYKFYYALITYEKYDTKTETYQMCRIPNIVAFPTTLNGKILYF